MRRVVRAHDGKVEVESEVGEGSTGHLYHCSGNGVLSRGTELLKEGLYRYLRGVEPRAMGGSRVGADPHGDRPSPTRWTGDKVEESARLGSRMGGE